MKNDVKQTILFINTLWYGELSAEKSAQNVCDWMPAGRTLVAVVGGKSTEHVYSVPPELQRMEVLDVEKRVWTLTEHALPYIR